MPWEKRDSLEPVRWKNGVLEAIDTTRLPGRLVYVRMRTVDQVCSAIRSMKVRGAPLIGVVGAYGLVLAAMNVRGGDLEQARSKLRRSADALILTRPTGVNLRWAVERVFKASSRARSVVLLREELRREADMILREELEAAHKIGRFGAALIDDGDTVLTHCNAGSLATAGYGTALAVVRSAVEAQGVVDKVVVGADRILGTGHVTNKIGTLPIALGAKFYGVPFYVAAPASTLDLVTDVSRVVIEERDQREVLSVGGRRFAPRNVGALNPAFDITPPELVTGIVTDRGVVALPLAENIRAMFG